MNLIEILTLFISIIGACAWIPEIVRTISYSSSKIQSTLIDVVHIKNFTLTSEGDKNQLKKGQLLILAVDFFSYYKSIFVRSYDVEISLDFGDRKPIRASIGNRVSYKQPVNGSVIPMKFDFPLETNLFVNPLFVCGQNNIRIIPCLLENLSVEKSINLSDIKEVKFTYRNKREKTVIVDCDNERFNFPHYLEQYITKDIVDA